MTRFMCLFAGMVSAAVVTAQDQLPNLPRGVAPTQGLAAVRDGKLYIRTLTYYYAPKTVCDPKTNKCETTYVQNHHAVAREYRVDHVHAYDVRGNRIASKRLAKLLADETPVLVSSDQQMVDPLHLRVYRSDMVVLVLKGEFSLLTPPAATPVAPTPVAPITYEIVPPPVVALPPVKPGAPAELRMSIHQTFQHFAGEECRYTIQVGNVGGTKAVDVVLYVRIPDKMSVPMLKLADDRRLMTAIGDLQPGEWREETLVLSAAAKGEFMVQAEVVADAGLKANAKRTLYVRDQEKTSEPPK